MSTLYCRRKVRAWAKALPNSHYIETINDIDDISGIDIALAADFAADGIVSQTYCGDEVETGTITLSWIGRPGQGDEDLIAAAEADSALFYANRDTRLALLQRGSPETYNTSGQQPRFIVDITYGYELMF